MKNKMKKLEPSAYYTWLMMISGGDPEVLSKKLYEEARTNKEAQTLLMITGSPPEDEDVFMKSANMLCALYYENKQLINEVS